MANNYFREVTQEAREASAQRSRRERWTAPGRGQVIHPTYGSVIVPCSSKLGAILNAAEYWGVDAYDLMKDGPCTVEAVEKGTGKVVVPRELLEERKNGTRNSAN